MMFDLRLSARELEIVRAALMLTGQPEAVDVVTTIDIQRGERVNNFGRGQE